MMLSAPPTASGGTPSLMLLERVARREDQGELRFFAFGFGLRLQRVDGRRLDAFVAALHCSRVRRGAAPIVS